jgi:hypothetical protein
MIATLRALSLPELFALTALLALFPAATVSPAAAQALTESEALHVATAWLELVDAGRYDESVARAAPLFREMVGSGEGWGAFLQSARARYPVEGTRSLTLFEPEVVPEAAPPGSYARLSFQPSAAPGTTEVIMLMHTHDGWRVAMYGLTGGYR